MAAKTAEVPDSRGAVSRDPFDFSDIPIPEEIAEPVTLEQVLGEPISLGTLWPGAFYLSPKMRELKGLFRGLAELESREPGTWEEIERLMDDYCALARRIVRVPNADAPVGIDPGFRPPTIDEIQARFDLQELKRTILRMLLKDGFQEENQGNADGEPTGAQDTGASGIGSPA